MNIRTTAITTRPQAITTYIPYAVGLLILTLLPLLLPPYYQIVMSKILIFGLFAMSLDLIWGYTGLFSLGHAAFWGSGGYVVGILMVRYEIKSFWVGAPIAILTAILVAAILGIIALRVAGVYFLLITFALGELLVSIATKWKYLSTTISTEGVLNISPPDLGLLNFDWNNLNFYYFVLANFVGSYYLLQRIIRSPFGYTLKGIRESEDRMQVLGYNTWLYKYIAYIVAGAFAGVAGVLMAYHDGFMVPASFGIATSALVLLMVIIGGTGTLNGAVLGAVAIILIELFASMYTPQRWPLFLGAAFVLSVMYLKGGIYGYMFDLWKKGLSKWRL